MESPLKPDLYTWKFFRKVDLKKQTVQLVKVEQLFSSSEPNPRFVYAYYLALNRIAAGETDERVDPLEATLCLDGRYDVREPTLLQALRGRVGYVLVNVLAEEKG